MSEHRSGFGINPEFPHDFEFPALSAEILHELNVLKLIR
jgi:hypothetical protein